MSCFDTICLMKAVVILCCCCWVESSLLPVTHSSLMLSCWVMSDFLRPHGLQHARLPCPSVSPRLCSTLCPLSRYCHPTISSAVSLSSCLQSFPASGFFPVSRLLTSGSQSIGTSASASVLPMIIQGWFPFRLTGLISLLSKELTGAFSSTTAQRHQILQCSAFFIVQLSQL